MSETINVEVEEEEEVGEEEEEEGDEKSIVRQVMHKTHGSPVQHPYYRHREQTLTEIGLLNVVLGEVNIHGLDTHVFGVEVEAGSVGDADIGEAAHGAGGNAVDSDETGADRGEGPVDKGTRGTRAHGEHV